MVTNSLERGILSSNDFKKTKVKIYYTLMLAFLVIVSLSTLFPLVWLFLGTFKSSAEMFKVPPAILPEQWSWQNYSLAWTKLRFQLYALNTMYILFGTLITSVLFSSLAGYSLAKLRPVGGKKLLYLFLIALMVPPQVYLIPLYLNLKELPIFHISLLNSYWALWLMGGANAFAILVFKSFFAGIPNEMLEAARVEGAKEMRIFTKIVAPLSTPVIAVISIFTMNGVWQDFLWPYIILSDEQKQPIMVALWRMGKAFNLQFNVYLSGMVIALILPIVLFLVFQKYILQGLSLSGIKG